MKKLTSNYPHDFDRSAHSEDGLFLHLLLRGPGAVAAVRIEDHASLTPLGVTVCAMPVNDAY